MNTVVDPTVAAEVETVHLHGPTDELPVLVEDIGPLYGYPIRSVPYPPQTNKRHIVTGDKLEIAEPFTLRILIVEDTEIEARVALEALRAYAVNVLHIEHQASTTYRHLHGGGRSVQRFDPVRVDQRRGGLAWWAQVTFLPVFPRHTTAKITTVSAYLADPAVTA